MTDRRLSAGPGNYLPSFVTFMRSVTVVLGLRLTAAFVTNRPDFALRCTVFVVAKFNTPFQGCYGRRLHPGIDHVISDRG